MARFIAVADLSRWRIAGIVFVLLWFFLGGIAYFALTQTEMRIVPPTIPWPRAAVLVSGAFELLGVVGCSGAERAAPPTSVLSF